MKYIESLREGEKVNEVYLCKFKQAALTKAGKAYDNVILQDKTGTIDAKIWDPGSVGIDEFDALDYVAVTGDVTSFQGNLQMSIRRARRVSEEDIDPKEYLPCTDKDVEEMYAEFVEKNPKACTCIRENLSFTKLTDGGKLLNMDVLQALRSLEGGEPFDCIFMDAPYEQHLEQPVLEYLADSTLADENTLIVVEEDLHTDFSYVEDLGYHLVRSKEYKTNKHVFLKK